MKKPKMIGRNKAAALVHECAETAHAAMMEKLDGIHPKQRYLIYTRAVTLCFAKHFQMSLNRVQDHIGRLEKQLEQESGADGEEGEK